MDRPTPKALTGIAPVTRERDIEHTCAMYWEHMLLMHRKISGPGQNHWPDRVFINSDGLHLYIEFKAKGKLPTPNQARQLNRMRNIGCHVYVIDNIEDGKTLLNLFANSLAYIEAIDIGIDIFNVERATQH